MPRRLVCIIQTEDTHLARGITTTTHRAQTPATLQSVSARALIGEKLTSTLTVNEAELHATELKTKIDMR